MGLCHNATAQPTTLPRKHAVYLHVVMPTLSPCPAISPESAPPPFFLHGVVGIQRYLTTSPSNHYEAVCRHRYSYRRRSLIVWRNNVVSPRLGLGYRPPWQVAGVEGEPVFTECRLCHSMLSNTIEQFCQACPTVRGLLSQEQPPDAVCRHLLCIEGIKNDVLCYKALRN